MPLSNFPLSCREKNLIISLVSTALSHQNMYFDTKQTGDNYYKANTDTNWSRREKLSNNDPSLNETVEDEEIQNCCTVTDRLVIGEMDNINETHSRGVQANLSSATSEDTLKSNNTEVNKTTNRDECSSLCQTPLKQNWKQHESVGIH
uniref:Protein TBATA n=1 Tax=Schistosoma mansoni TaxID=6183 RepID=A0AA82MW68_SCHMA